MVPGTGRIGTALPELADQYARARLGVLGMSEAERKTRALERQRLRRSRKRRLDYYADGGAVAVIDSLRKPSVGGDASSILNRIVSEWANARKAAT